LDGIGVMSVKDDQYSAGCGQDEHGRAHQHTKHSALRSMVRGCGARSHGRSCLGRLAGNWVNRQDSFE